jgi:hypothetical protein
MNNYHSEIWADKAGYYMYLPAFFKYHMNAELFPTKIDVRTGNGFRLDTVSKKVLTKYTCGVAILQLPFYLAADCLSALMNTESDGFSKIYHKAIDISSVFYLIWGLYFLRRVLLFYFEREVVLLTIAVVFFGTNLYYYSIDETGMSHIYSFAMFSTFLFLIKKTNFMQESTNVAISMLAIISALIVLIRPINVIFFLTYFFIDLRNKEEFLLRVKRLFNMRVFGIGSLMFSLLLLPQLLYWQYAFGHFVKYTYANEGFEWAHPKILQTLFAPNNGLLLYCPYFLFIVVGSIYMLIKRHSNGMFIFLLFVILTYIFSCWWDRSFGCSFGARSYVEYLTLFCLPVGYLQGEVKNFSKGVRIGFYILTLFFIYFNLKLTYSYDGCFYGGNWDWERYFYLVTGPTK